MLLYILYFFTAVSEGEVHNKVFFLFPDSILFICGPGIKRPKISASDNALSQTPISSSLPLKASYAGLLNRPMLNC